MDWVSNYQLFLFDFDGLLVNTEWIHFSAYQRMVAMRGFTLPWTFEEYCLRAHYGKERLYASLLEACPGLDAPWEELYRVKQGEVRKLLLEGAAELMPGVESLLKAIKQEGKVACVVTNSPEEFVVIARKQFPMLNQIAHWVTREHYQEPKPHPECYLYAIERYGKASDRVVGFEDTPKGVQALLGTRAQPVFVTKIPYPEIEQFVREGVKVVSSLV